MRRLATMLAATAIVVAGGCTGIRGQLAFAEGLARAFPRAGAISATRMGSVLTVTFVNSPVAQLPDSAKGTFALRVAEYVRDHYVGYRELAVIRVGFTRQAGIGPVTAATTQVPYAFSPWQLGAPEDSAPAR